MKPITIKNSDVKVIICPTKPKVKLWKSTDSFVIKEEFLLLKKKGYFWDKYLKNIDLEKLTSIFSTNLYCK